MTFRLPPSLRPEHGSDEPALRVLRKYYFTPRDDPNFFTGSLFDTWDPSGQRHQDRNRFTADDVVSVTMLSVDVPAIAADDLLIGRSSEFSDLLHDLGDDEDLVDVTELPDDGAGWRLMDALRSLPGVGATTASKLLARKRPRLRPIYDSVVAAVTGTTEQQWDPLRRALRENGRQLHNRLLQLRDDAGLPTAVSAIRVLDVVAWMDGKRY